jgi:predicted nucleotide-binding protein (sugar kinase/HSP70/actin superfamily)
MTCEAWFPGKNFAWTCCYAQEQCDYLYMPMLIEMESNQGNNSFYCPMSKPTPTCVWQHSGSMPARLSKPAVYFKKGKLDLRHNFAAEFKRLGLPFNASEFDKATTQRSKAQFSSTAKSSVSGPRFSKIW